MRNNVGYYYITAIVSPIVAVILSIRGLKWDQKKSLLIFIIFIFGLTVTIFSVSGDLSVHYDRVESVYSDMSVEQFFYGIYLIVTLSADDSLAINDDLYIHVLSFFTGRILKIPILFLGIAAWFYGLFYIKSMANLLKWKSWSNKGILFWLIITFFILYRFVDNFQTIRFWTGGWVLFYGSLRYFKTKKLKYLLLLLTPPLIHVAYFAVAVPVYAVLFTKSFRPLFFIIIYLSSFIAAPSLDIITQAAKSTSIGASKIENYNFTPEERQTDLAKQEDKSGNWYAEYGKRQSSHWATQVFAFTIIFTGLFSRIRLNPVEYALIASGLLMVAAANFGYSFYAFYNRTLTLAGLFIFAAIVLLICRDGLFKDKSALRVSIRKAGIWGGVLLLTPGVLYTLSNILQLTSAFMFFLPFLGVFFPEANLSIRDVIGDIL